MAYNNEDTETKLISKINSAALINLTLNNLWNECYKYSTNGDLSKWNSKLNCLWIELGGDVDKDGDQEKDFNKIQEELSGLGKFNSLSSKGFKTPNKKDVENNAKQYDILLKKSLFLKRLQFSQGKGTAYQDSTDDYMD